MLPISQDHRQCMPTGTARANLSDLPVEEDDWFSEKRTNQNNTCDQQGGMALTQTQLSRHDYKRAPRNKYKRVGINAASVDVCEKRQRTC